MSKMKLPRQTIIKDVSEALREIDRIGLPKRLTTRGGKTKKDTGRAHSYSQKDKNQSASMGFVKWVKDKHGVKRLNHIKESHVRQYIEFKKSEGCGAGHLQNIETSLNHLQNASKAYFARFDRKIEPFMPKERITSWKDGKAPENRSYTDKEVSVVKNGVSENVGKVVELMRGLGLRSSEAVNVRREHFVQDGDGWKLVIGKGEGITKGGRPREIPVRKSFQPVLEKLVDGKKETDRLVELHERTVRRGVSAVLKKAGIEQNRRGSHGFRHAYARERVSELMQERGLNEKGYTMLQRCLSNRESGRRADYAVFRTEDRQLYDQVKSVVDQVHEELGHGQDRWDLAAVYMKN